jgi:hypothetical protein
LRDLIENPDKEKIDGVRIWLAAYIDERYQHDRTGQQSKMQSTIILVPTHDDKSGGHVDDWDVIKRRAGLTNFAFLDGYNHGELCPKICPPGE